MEGVVDPGTGGGDSGDSSEGFHLDGRRFARGWGGGGGFGSESGADGGEVAGYGARAKVVVAYWSYDYREHAMGHLTRGLFCSHQASQ